MFIQAKVISHNGQHSHTQAKCDQDNQRKQYIVRQTFKHIIPHSGPTLLIPTCFKRESPHRDNNGNREVINKNIVDFVVLIKRLNTFGITSTLNCVNSTQLAL